MAFQPGQSGNPNGRPPKEQSLTHILSIVAEETSNLTPGSPKQYQYKEILAHYIWQAAVFGKFRFRDGRLVAFEGDDWLKLVKWLYDRIDGLPRASVGLSGEDGGAIPIQLFNSMLEKVYGDDNGESGTE